jgi:hypothetical protein
MKTSERAISVLALIVSISSGVFSYMQSRTSAAQLRLVEQQLRPHVSYVPTFFRTKTGLNVDMYLQNQSPLPANVLYTDLAAWVGDDFLSPNFHSMSPDIVHQEKGGISSPPPIKGKPLSRIEAGESLTLATCVIYASTSKSDSRRWRLQAMHGYVPGSSLPRRLLIQEEEAPPSQAKCSAREVRALMGEEGKR